MLMHRVILKVVDVMDEVVYQALSKYYNVLEKTGYMSDINVRKLLLLSFYRDFVYSDYRGILSKDDYLLIERALDCLYGSTCLIPYPDYLKMGKLNLGSITELGQRVRELEETEVLKLSDLTGQTGSDILVYEEDEE